MADSTYKTVLDLIQSTFATEYDKDGGGSGAYEVQYENEGGFEKPQDSVYMRLTIIPGAAETIMIGSTKTFRMSGNIVVQIIGPSFAGLKTAGEDDVKNLSGTVQEFFAYKTIGTGTNTVRCYAPYPTKIGRQGGEFIENVNIPFTVDFTKT